MNYFLGLLPLAAVIFGIINGKTAEMSSAMLNGAENAVTLVISLCGIMCLWCGIMKVAEHAGAVRWLSRLMSPLISLLFKGLKRDGKAAELISLNLSANLMGLGNASTPLGLSAMKALAEEEPSETATDNMIMLTVLNTASLQLIPTTAAALRAAAGAQKPMEILPCVWIVSIYSVTVAVMAAKLFSAVSRLRKTPKQPRKEQP